MDNFENESNYNNQNIVKNISLNKKINIKTCNSSQIEESMFDYLDSLDTEVDNYDLSPLYKKLNLKK